MASLQNQQIDQTYAGLIKTNDEAALGATEKVIQDGAGNNSTLSMGTASASFTGTLDLSGATVTGLPAASAGLESGTGADSMQSAASLTTVAANASGASAIALGDSATAPNEGDVNIGDGNTIATKASLPGDVVIGQGNNSQTVNGGENIMIGKDNTITQNEQNIAIGKNNTISRGTIMALGHNNTATSAYGQVILGFNNTGSSGDSVIIGTNASATGSGGDGRIAIGKGSAATKNKAVVVGVNNCSSASEGVAIGDDVDIASNSDRTIAIGNAISVGSGAADSIVMGTSADSTAQKGIALGFDAHVTATEGIALGYQVTADKAQTVSMKALDLQTPSTPTAGGIIMTDAGSTERRLNITAAGELQIDSTPVGGGGSEAYPARYVQHGTLSTATEGPYTFFSGDAIYYPVYMKKGEVVSEISLEITTAFTDTTLVGMAIYTTQMPTNVSSHGTVAPKDLGQDFGTVDATTTGIKTLSSSTYTAPYTGFYSIGFNYNGIWDGEFRTFAAPETVGQANAFYIEASGNGFDSTSTNAYRLLRDDTGGTGFPSSYTQGYSWDSTTAEVFMVAKTQQNA